MYVKRVDKDFKILDVYHIIAHGGIYGNFTNRNGSNRFIESNTYISCKLAIDNNIPFECDIRQTKDDIPIITHDNVFDVEGKEYKFSRMNYSEIKELLGKKAPCTLKKVLEYNNGRVPVLIDAKESKFIVYSKYRRNLCDLLNEYAQIGEIALQSFNPVFMLVMREYLVGVLTIQLICRAQTLLSVFDSPKLLARSYEKIISVICVIARTDAINMENHEDIGWRFKTRFFHDSLYCEKIEEFVSEINEKIDKFQYKAVRVVSNLTRKPVLSWTIRSEEEFFIMETKGKKSLIQNWVVDFSAEGVERYIEKMKKYQ